MISRTRPHTLRILVPILTLAVLTLSGWFRVAPAATLINEVTLNSENSGGSGTDTGKEFFELLSDSGAEMLTGLTFVVIEGEGGSKGIVDQALSLSGFSTGSNGLFLWRDAADVLSPAPDPATVVNVADFVPDIENGSETFVLAAGFTGMVGDDLDTDDDGVLDVTPWSSVADSVGVKDGTAADAVYATQLGGVDFASVGFAADSIVRLTVSGEWVATDINETISEFPGPYVFDDTQAQLTDGTPFVPSTDLTFNWLTPGNDNPAFVPEPSSLLMALFALACLTGPGVCRQHARNNR